MFWRYAKSLDNMAKFDQMYCVIVEKIRFLIFTSFVSDIYLFSLNELVHHDMTVRNQTKHSRLSYAIVFLCYSLSVYDTIRLFMINRDYFVPAITKENKNNTSLEMNEIEKRRQDMSFDNSRMQLNLRELEEEEEEHKEHELRKRRKHSSNGSSGDSLNKMDSLGSKKRKKTFATNAYKDKEDTIGAQELGKKYSSYLQYFSEGIKMSMLGNPFAKYYNTCAIIRLLAFEPFLISLQLFPVTQVLCVFGIQALFYWYTIKAIFTHKVFRHKVFSINFLINETFLFVFLVVCCYLAFIDTEQVDKRKFEKFQIGVISLIILIAILNVFIFLANLYLSVKLAYAKFKEKKRKTEIKRKTFLQRHKSEMAAQVLAERFKREGIMERSDESDSGEEPQKQEREKKKDEGSTLKKRKQSKYSQKSKNSGKSGKLSKQIREGRKVDRSNIQRSSIMMEEREFLRRKRSEMKSFSKSGSSSGNLDENTVNIDKSRVGEDFERKKRLSLMKEQEGREKGYSRGASMKGPMVGMRRGTLSRDESPLKGKRSMSNADRVFDRRDRD